MGRIRAGAGGTGRAGAALSLWHRWQARQFARPHGLAGRLLLGPWLDRISGPMNALALEALDLRGSEDVLEVGFGGGDLLARILERTGGTVFGADTSAAMVARARRRFSGEGSRLQLHFASAERLPIADAAVDRACSVNSIYFWPDPAAAMAELARVVRPGGTVSICFEPPSELRKWPGSRYGFRLFEDEEVGALMAAAGFGRIRCSEGTGSKPDFFLCLTAERGAAEAAA